MKLRAEKDPGSTWNKTVRPIAGGAVDTFKTQRIDEADETNSSPSTIEKLQDTSGPYHSVLVEERVWTANWVNQYVSHGNDLIEYFSFFLTDFLLMMHI